MWRPRPITFTFLTFLLMVTSLSVAAGTNSQSVEIEISESDAKDGLVVVGRWAPMLILLSIESGQFLLPGAYEGGNALAGGWVIDEPELMDSDQVLQIRIHHPDNPGHMQLISNEQTLKEGVAIRFPAGALRFSGDTSSPIAVSIHYESGVQADLVLSNTREINVDLDDEVEIAAQLRSLMGGWHDETHNGEGLVIHNLKDRDEVVIFWFTYDGLGMQRWFLGVGTMEGDKVTAELVVTSGGVFGSDFDPESVVMLPVGSLVLTMTDCDNLLLEYVIDGVEGEQMMNRTYLVAGSACSTD